MEVLSEGEALAENLRELSRSLDANAHRLLDDVRASHAALIATLDRVAPDRSRVPQTRPSASAEGARRGPRPSGPPLEPPEFLRRR